MARSERRKGASAERELAALLTDELGEMVKRRLGASRDGGHDLDGGILLDGIAIEVKRQERITLGAWWAQATEQALAAGKVPVLAYRASHQPWRFVVPLAWLHPGLRASDWDRTATLGLDEFCMVVREAAQ